MANADPNYDPRLNAILAEYMKRRDAGVPIDRQAMLRAYTVQSRYRLLGFELASGRYWPPFVWQHPKVAFDLVQFPIWVLVLVFSLLPAASILRKLRSIWRSPVENDLMLPAVGETADPK